MLEGLFKYVLEGLDAGSPTYGVPSAKDITIAPLQLYTTRLEFLVSVTNL